MPQPLYSTPERPAYQLHYAWTGWPSVGRFSTQPIHLIESTRSLWETDGLRALEWRWTDKEVQILFSAKPDVAPVHVAARAKGRLDHALRQSGLSIPFSRKVAIRAIGDNTRRDIEAYIERQVPRARLVDARFAEAVAQLAVANPEVDLCLPSESARGRYWYNLHVVLIVQRHQSIGDLDVLRLIRDQSVRIAAKKEHVLSRLSVMPDHLHLALRGQIDESPAEIALTYQNNLAYARGQRPIWADGFYVGTFSEYTTHVVHRLARECGSEELDE